MKTKPSEVVLMGLFIAFLIVVIESVVAGVLYAGWNWLVAPAFHLASCSLLQCYAAVFLLAIFNVCCGRASGSKSE